MRIPAHTTPAYVCARIRKILAGQGCPLHKLSGRYTPYFSKQTGTEGFSVRKVGCSKFISVGYSASYGEGRSRDLPHGVAQVKVAEAIALLRKRGYRINDIGWIECDH